MQININHLPTLNDMVKLTNNQYYLWNNKVYVNAIGIDKIHIRFICPFCYSCHNKNSSKQSKSITHIHGSNNKFHNRFEYRLPHCLNQDINNSSFAIAITDNTIREN